jgi:hypothetical protein
LEKSGEERKECTEQGGTPVDILGGLLEHLKKFLFFRNQAEHGESFSRDSLLPYKSLTTLPYFC